MKRIHWGVGVWVLAALVGCGEKEMGPESKVGAPSGGTAGSGGSSLDLGLEGGKGGGGASGAAGASGSGGAPPGGAPAGGSASGGGSAGGNPGGGAGGSDSLSKCTRAPASDADCADFYAGEGYTQAYGCTDLVSAQQLAVMLGKQCASVSFVPGAARGACCPPVP